MDKPEAPRRPTPQNLNVGARPQKQMFLSLFNWFHRAPAIIGGLLGKLTVGALAIIGLIALGEMIPRILNNANEATALPSAENKSRLFPEPTEDIPTASEILGQMSANLEAEVARELAAIQGENEVRMRGVEAMVRTREQLMEGEVSARLSVLKSRLEETSRANGPRVMRAFFFEFGCVVESAFCPAAEATTDEIVAFFDKHVMNAPEYKLLFSDEELRKAAGYNSETGEWDNGVGVYLK